MKRVKFFFGIAFLCLAIAGAIATKANNGFFTYHYVDGAGICQSIVFPAVTCRVGSGECLYDVGGTIGVVDLYKSITHSTCTDKLTEFD